MQQEALRKPGYPPTLLHSGLEVPGEEFPSQMREYQPKQSPNATSFVSEERKKTKEWDKFQPPVLPSPLEDVLPLCLAGAPARERNLMPEALLSPLTPWVGPLPDPSLLVIHYL